MIFGGALPIFGLYIPEILFAMAMPPESENYRANINFWAGMMFLTAMIAMVGGFFGKFFFAMTGSNITFNVRKDTYKSIL